MINKLKEILGLNDKVGVIGIVNYKDSQEYFYVILTKDKNDLNVVEFKNNIQTLDTLKNINKNIPLIIALTGSGIVYTRDTNNLIFNSNVDDYYITEYTTDNKEVLTAFSRKDNVDKLVHFFTQSNYFIVDVVIGVLSTNLLYKKVFTDNEIQVNDLVLQYNKIDCIDYIKTKPNVQSTIYIDNEKKNTLELFLFSIGFNYFSPSNKLVNKLNNFAINQNKVEFNYKKQFDRIVKIGFLIFIISLIINFSLKSFISNEINKINNLVTNTTKYQNEFNYLSKERNKKRTVIEMAGFLNPNFLSFYINEIGNILPKDINLKELIIFPINSNNITQNKQIEINDRKILILGSTLSNSSFNLLLEKLRSKKWVNKIEIIHFEDDKKNKSNYKLEISLK